jgi:hypothetical protein
MIAESTIAGEKGIRPMAKQQTLSDKPPGWTIPVILAVIVFVVLIIAIGSVPAGEARPAHEMFVFGFGTLFALALSALALVGVNWQRTNSQSEKQAELNAELEKIFEEDMEVETLERSGALERLQGQLAKSKPSSS